MMVLYKQGTEKSLSTSAQISRCNSEERPPHKLSPGTICTSALCPGGQSALVVSVPMDMVH